MKVSFFALAVWGLCAIPEAAALPSEIEGEAMIHCSFAKQGSFDLKASDRVAMYFPIGVLKDGYQNIEVFDGARVLDGASLNHVRRYGQSLAISSENPIGGHLVIVKFDKRDASGSYLASTGLMSDQDGSDLRFGRCLVFSGTDARQLLDHYRNQTTEVAPQ